MNEIEKAIDTVARMLGLFPRNSEPTKAKEIAISALREKLEREKNEPLTLDELRKMYGEPVWVVWPDGRVKSQWWVIGDADWKVLEFFRDYGKTHVAYRNKPSGQEPGRDV